MDQGERAFVKTRKSVGGAKRRRILDRDGYACQVCFTAGGAEYSDKPGARATLTIGHIVPVARGGSDDDDNLRAQSASVATTKRETPPRPLPDMAEVMTSISRVGSRKDKQELFLWTCKRGQRMRSEKERVFNDWTRLPLGQRHEVMMDLASQVIADEEAPRPDA